MPIKCTCGNKGCTTELMIYESTGYIDLIVYHKEGETEKRETIGLDANEIVRLIKELKESLMNIAS